MSWFRIPLDYASISDTPPTNKKHHPVGWCFLLVGEGGFEPPKALPADLQSVPFGHSGIPPYAIALSGGAGGRTRTPDLLITNQLLYRLSYTSVLPASLCVRISTLTPERFVIIAKATPFVNHFFQEIEKYRKALVAGDSRHLTFVEKNRSDCSGVFLGLVFYC